MAIIVNLDVMLAKRKMRPDGAFREGGHHHGQPLHSSRPARRARCAFPRWTPSARP